MERKVGQNRQPSSVFGSILYRYLLWVLFPIQTRQWAVVFLSWELRAASEKLVNWRRDWFACASALVPCGFTAFPSRLLSTDLKWQTKIRDCSQSTYKLPQSYISPLQATFGKTEKYPGVIVGVRSSSWAAKDGFTSPPFSTRSGFILCTLGSFLK